MMFPHPLRVIRYGSNDPLPQKRLLKAGNVTAFFEGGGLKNITVGETEVVREIYAAVRDKNWGTVEPKFSFQEINEEDDSFIIRFTAEHKDNEIDFVWNGLIEGRSEGVVFSLEGKANKSFLRNRIGFCILHPMELAGSLVEVDQTTGIKQGEFPKQISPHQPFIDMVGIRHKVKDVEVKLKFEGDIFEMEDQRNWTDASYKTYCTPLSLPFPVEIKEGDVINQKVTLQVKEDGELKQPKEVIKCVEVNVSENPICKLPKIGISQNPNCTQLTEKEIARLKYLNLSTIQIKVDLTDSNWKNQLKISLKNAKSLNLGLDFEVIAEENCEGINEFISVLKGVNLPIIQLLVYSSSSHVTTEPIILKVKKLVEEAGLTIKIGGGSRAFFTELNRAKLPLDQMDLINYTINPQVHAFDNHSLIETISAQPITVESAREIAPNLPISISPITFKMRFNPNATGSASQLKPGELPQDVDVRQMSLFGAGWTLGSIHQLGKKDVTLLSYFETTGMKGVMEDTGETVFPMYHIFAEIGEYKESEILDASVNDPLSGEVLALRKGSAARILVTNYKNKLQKLQLHLPKFSTGKLRFLDETSVVKAMVDPNNFRSHYNLELKYQSEQPYEIEMYPYGIACIDIELL